MLSYFGTFSLKRVDLCGHFFEGSPALFPPPSSIYSRMATNGRTREKGGGGKGRVDMHKNSPFFKKIQFLKSLNAKKGFICEGNV